MRGLVGLALGDLVPCWPSIRGQAVPVLGLVPHACGLDVDAMVLLWASASAATAELDRGILVPHVIDLLVGYQALLAGVVAHSHGLSQLAKSHTFWLWPEMLHVGWRATMSIPGGMQWIWKLLIPAPPRRLLSPCRA